MVPVRIASLAVDPRSNQPVLLLKPLDEEPGAGLLLPIWIGQPEATSICSPWRAPRCPDRSLMT